VNEYAFTTLTSDESIAFGVVEPLNCSLFHCVANSFC
jgi:hypothetical protein